MKRMFLGILAFFGWAAAGIWLADLCLKGFVSYFLAQVIISVLFVVMAAFVLFLASSRLNKKSVSAGFKKKHIALLIIGALFLPAIFSPAMSATGEKEEILFISSYEELGSVLVKFAKGEEIRGLAISANFYNQANQGTRNSIDSFVAFIISLQFRPVFVYGQPLDAGLAEKLLGREVLGCEPLVIAGVFPSIEIKSGVSDVVNTCVACDKILSEEDFRKMITNHWQRMKETTLKDWGYKLLDDCCEEKRLKEEEWTR